MDDDTRSRVLSVLASVAPEAEEVELEDDVTFRDQIDFDSMDLLNFAIALSKEFGIEIPETDYPNLTTLGAATAYVRTQSA